MSTAIHKHKLVQQIIDINEANDGCYSDVLDKMFADFPSVCGNCESPKWMMGAYNDDVDIVCGMCSGTVFDLEEKAYSIRKSFKPKPQA